jgi:Holliday junction resolvase-like predicted endonuclease
MPKKIEDKMEKMEDKIRAWLATQGYRFELVVARAFQKAGFRVTVSEFRRDPDTGEPREIDVVATHTGFLPHDELFDLNFVIECKHSRSNPWVVFSVALHAFPWRLEADVSLLKG